MGSSSLHRMALYCIELCISVLMNCAIDPMFLAGGTETGDASVVGYVYMQSGMSYIPAPNASVTFILYGSHPDSAVSVSTATDAEGFYRLDKRDIQLGLSYNVFAEKWPNKEFVENAITVTNTFTIDTLVPIILKATGSVSGVVRLSGAESNETIYILLPGTNVYTQPDTQGNFTLDSLAPGLYPVHIITEADGYQPFDTTFSITENIADTLSDTIYLIKSNTSPVTGLSIKYKSNQMTTHLSWNKSTSPTIKGYNVYRGRTGLQPSRINGTLITDTVYTDDMIEFADWTVIYALSSVDSNGSESQLTYTGELPVVTNATSGNPLQLTEVPEYCSFSFDADANKIYAGFGRNLYSFNTDGSSIKKFTSDSFDSTFPVDNFSHFKVRFNKVYVACPTEMILLDTNCLVLDSIQAVIDTSGASSLFDVSESGELFLATREPGNSTRIRKFNSNDSLIKTIVIDDYITGLQTFGSQVMVSRYHAEDFTIYRDSLLIDRYDSDLNYITHQNLNSYLYNLTQTPVNTEAAGFVVLEKGYKVLTDFMEPSNGLVPVLVLTPDDTVAARLLLPERIVFTDNTEHFYIFEGTKLIPYSFK